MTMTPAASKFVMGAKAAARGTLNRQAMMQSRMGTKRWLTLPPGSVRGIPSMEEYHQDRSTDDSQETESRERAQMQMSPQRNYGTVSEMPQNTQHFDPIAASFREDYDNLNVHSTAASCTTSSLGQLYEESADIFSTTLTGDVLHFSDLPTFSADQEEDYFTALERKLGICNLENHAMVDDGKNY
ncbi:unnamed protein product [Cylindrotheca closterium]|uniref:Uncharacterized protein n=1 Tax=Cylindrotheca closterium TaxID=2856 RepID=A0AAD2G0D2_9STRA|nr:unnamed protein product [Cylindrotheca closterium]